MFSLHQMTALPSSPLHLVPSSLKVCLKDWHSDYDTLLNSANVPPPPPTATRKKALKLCQLFIILRISCFPTSKCTSKPHQVNKLSHTDTTFRSHSMQEKTAYLRPALGALQRKAMETEEEKEQKNKGCRWSDNSEGADDWVSTRERD